MHDSPTVFIIEENDGLVRALKELLLENDFRVKNFPDGMTFLRNYREVANACVLFDTATSSLNAAEFVKLLHEKNHVLPTIMISRDEATALAIEAVGNGGVEFIKKPICCVDVLKTIRRALKLEHDLLKSHVPHSESASLTVRQLQILDLLLAGNSNKAVASELGLSQRTVEAHRAAIMTKLGADNTSSLVRAALCSRCPRK
jgi:two-component system, chemotaxis family, CheB/CheR fusion protein